jgi:hypothetical protein
MVETKNLRSAQVLRNALFGSLGSTVTKSEGTAIAV